MSMNSAVMAPTIRVEGRGFRGGRAAGPEAYADEPSSVPKFDKFSPKK
jgi:hypothetical protein